MKKIIKLSFVLAVSTLLFSSCSKTKYTASFSPSRSKLYTKPVAKKAIETKTIAESNITASVMKTPVIVENVTTSTKTNTVKNTNINDSKISTETLVASSFTKKEMRQSKRNVRKSLIKSAKKSGGVNIVHLILALFPILCLIAVYLHQGSAITNDFWLDLILHFTIIGAPIFAVLVVLDIISIA